MVRTLFLKQFRNGGSSLQNAVQDEVTQVNPNLGRYPSIFPPVAGLPASFPSHQSAPRTESGPNGRAY